MAPMIVSWFGRKDSKPKTVQRVWRTGELPGGVQGSMISFQAFDFSPS
jgi:hypothetical protein